MVNKREQIERKRKKSVMVSVETHRKLEQLALVVGVNMPMSLVVDVVVGVTTPAAFKSAMVKFLDEGREVMSEPSGQPNGSAAGGGRQPSAGQDARPVQG